MSTITTRDGIEIFYKDWGKGQPIVFSYGWPLSADDMAIRVLPVAESSLIRRHLATFRFIAAATPEYIEKHGRPEHPSDLAQHNCLIFYDASVGKGGKE